MHPIILPAIGLAVVFKLLSSGTQDVANAADTGSNAAVKLALAGGVGLFALKKAKVI